ncbi:MAG: Ig-like domain-containing protein, partial [Gammaproteobacteria bacterium]|nr:Ig-like domain-containing protein [Gammaproteobacteria bacterium]
MFRVLSTLSDKLFRDITVFSLMTVMLSACGGGGGSTGTTTQSSAFSVQSTSPLNSATQKSDFPVVAIFSEPVNEATVDTTTFSVDDEFGNPITGIISFSGDKSVVIYTPDLELTDAMNYVATVTTAVTNATGKPLATNKSWSFRASAKANYACVINTPPVGLGLNSYYTKYCDANGMPVIGGNLVPDAALQMAWTQTMNMMK